MAAAAAIMGSPPAHQPGAQASCNRDHSHQVRSEKEWGAVAKRIIDGKTYKTLKRHLTSHGLDPKSYRDRYGLPADYPMVAGEYAERRSALAKAIGLGLQGSRAA